MRSDIEVLLADGTYRLEAPIQLTAADSGSNGFVVRWRAADGAHPILSGGSRVTGWTLADPVTGIFAVQVPDGSKTRNLYVDGKSATRARTKFIRPAASAFTPLGLTMTAEMEFLRNLTPQQLTDVEIRGLNSFTDRYSRVDSLSADGATLVMSQPAWVNNIWGWDHLGQPFHEGGFYAENALPFLDAANEWFLDTHTNTLYYKPADPATIDALTIELPRLEALFTISGTVADQAHHIELDGLTFTGSTWNEPTTTGGYVDQQTGCYMSLGSDYPEGGYPTFEGSRPHWAQMPSAVQISAATDVSIKRSFFTGLGAGGVGIGNDASAHLSGEGLAAQRISVEDSRFTAIGGSALTVGGIEQQAHHPGTGADGTRDPAISDATVAAMTISDIHVVNNRIWDVADTYTSATGILLTYSQNSVIAHNDVTDLPYGAINLGYGLGANDAGGNPIYGRRGLYNYQPIFSTPTTAKDNLVTANYIARYGTMHTDLGGFYNLSDNTGTIVSNNFIENAAHKGFYPDEGSRGLIFTNNVVVSGEWFGPNFGCPNVTDLSGSGNWVSEGLTAINGDRNINADRNILVEARLFDPAAIAHGQINEIIANAGATADDQRPK
ncbi:hypothetical protein ACFT2C_15465 [Promicromonospora sp. NPDC057138]|uniref:hypothetical protein n=1 Tax=Promicromonospora sp. NPDC057138 TaxID=3346031 RepID=UPI00363ED22F